MLQGLGPDPEPDGVMMSITSLWPDIKIGSGSHFGACSHVCADRLWTRPCAVRSKRSMSAIARRPAIKTRAGSTLSPILSARLRTSTATFNLQPVTQKARLRPRAWPLAVDALLRDRPKQTACE